MALTRIRAQQISDIDYKQAVRVITLTNITLSGGAPSSVDGVNLVQGDRILVNGQDDAAQNGLYQVQTLGTGSNGTWVRTSDGNEDGEIQPGMVVMVTQGNVYADTPWKLITNGVIEIGVTELTFEENYSLAFGNVFANGTAVVANTVSAPLTLSAGDNISIVGNNTSKTVTIGVTGISLNSISNGTSNVTVVSSGGNVTVGVAGSEVAEFSTVGLDVTGNITGSNIATAGELKSTGTFVIGTQQFFAQGSDGFSVNENFNAGNSTVTAYHYTSGAGRNGIVFDTAVTGQFTNGFGATGNAAQNKFVSFAEFSNTTWEWRKGVGISAPNLNGGTLLANINPDGNLYTLGTITATGNITGANINGGNLSLTGNVVSALNVTGNINTGNILTNGYFYANGAPFEPGGTPGGSNTFIQFNDDDQFGGSANLTWNGSELFVDGQGNVTGNLAVGGTITGNGIATTTVSSTPPADPEQGDIWIDSDTAIQYIYFNDGNSSQWAEMEAQVSFSSGSGGSVDFEDISSNVLPSANVTYNLGSSDKRWNDLWLANSTIHIGAANISATGGNLELPATVQIGNVTLQDSGSSFILPNDTIIGTAGVTLPNNGSFGFRNRIINGNMAIDQRRAGAAQTVTAAAALAYTVDRWYAYCTGANVTGQQVAGSGSSQYRYQFTGAASVTKIGFAQRIEAANSYDLNDTTATLSVDLANSLLTTVTWTASYANTADTFGTVASPTVTEIATGTFTVTSSVTRYSTQISIPSAAITGIQIEFSVGAQTSGTWTIGDVQLERGSAATPFEQIAIGTELALCQRYYQKSVSSATGFRFGSGYNIGTTTSTFTFAFRTSMRVAPSALETTGTAADYTVAHSASATACTVVPAFGASNQDIAVVNTTVASGLTQGQGSMLRAANATAFLAWSAEL